MPFPNEETIVHQNYLAFSTDEKKNQLELHLGKYTSGRRP